MDPAAFDGHVESLRLLSNGQGLAAEQETPVGVDLEECPSLAGDAVIDADLAAETFVALSEEVLDSRARRGAQTAMVSASGHAERAAAGTAVGSGKRRPRSTAKRNELRQVGVGRDRRTVHTLRQRLGLATRPVHGANGVGILRVVDDRAVLVLVLGAGDRRKRLAVAVDAVPCRARLARIPGQQDPTGVLLRASFSPAGRARRQAMRFFGSEYSRPRPGRRRSRV